MIFTNAAIVFPKYDIEHSIQLVLDPPMTACRVGKGVSISNALRPDIESLAIDKSGSNKVAMDETNKDREVPRSAYCGSSEQGS